MPRRNLVKQTLSEGGSQPSRAAFESMAMKLDLWNKVGLDFCTNCMSEDLQVTSGLCGDSSYIRCTMCGEHQV